MFGFIKDGGLPDLSLASIRDFLTDLVAVEEGEGDPVPVHIMRSLVEQHRISDWLPYSLYLEESQLFETTDGIGFVLEGAPMVGAGVDTAKLLSGLYMACPAGSGIQISMVGDNNLMPLFKSYANLCPEDEDNATAAPGQPKRRNENLFRALARKRIEYYIKGLRNDLFPQRNMVFMNYRLIISVLVPGKSSDRALLDRLLTLRDSVRQTLQTAGIPSFVWTAEDLVEFGFTMLNPNHMFAERPRDYPRGYDPDRELRHQMLARDTRVKVNGKSLRFYNDGMPEVDMRLYSVATYPRQFALWETAGLTGDEFHDALRYPCPFIITQGVHVLDFHKTKSMAMVQGARATQNASSQMARFTPDLVEKKQDWDVVVRRLDEGHGMIEMYHQIAIFARPKDIIRAEETVKGIWRGRGFTIDNDQYMQAQALLATLPLSLGQDLRSDLKKAERIYTKTSANAVHTMPIVAEWRGYGQPVMLFFGRKGQPCWFDFYDNPQGNYNVAISGVSGSGKSVLMNEISKRYRSVGAKVFIIDVGRSYEKLCRSMGGAYIEFTRQNPICINPFSWVHPDPNNDEGILEAIKMIKPLIAKMADPFGATDSYRMSRIEEAILAVWNEKGQQAEITDIATWLSRATDMEGRPDNRARDMAVQLFPYTRDGMYGRFFSGPATIDLRSDFIVLELEELKSSKDLQTVVMFVVMYRITNEMYLTRASRKVAIIDEAWQLLGDDAEAAEFINEGYRRARKYKGLFISGTQGVQDFFMTPAAEAALNNADWRIYLRQDEQKVEQLERDKKLVLSAADKRSLLSLRKEDGVYSELLVVSPVGSGVVRLIIDPFALKLASSTAEDFEAINNLRNQGLSVTEAIEQLLEMESRRGY